MITRDEIRLYKAQDNTDNDNGGGSMTGVEVVDGEINNLFPDISRIDTVNGDVSMRKMFSAVITENTDIYYGAHSIVRKNPDDARVSVVLAHTDDPHDTRIQAQQRVESYMSLSYEAIFYLYGNHIQGMKALTFLSRPENDSPEIGEVYVLTNGTHTQYVRVQAVDDTEVLLSFSSGGNFTDYKRKLSIVTITQALEHDFEGSAFSPAGNLSDVHTYHTAIANATKFYGTKTLAEDFTTSQTGLVVDSIHQQLVPSTLQQTPMVNKPGTPDLNVLITATDLNTVSNALPHYANRIPVPTQSVYFSAGNNYEDTLKTGMPIEPGSLSSIWGSSDDGSGVLTGTSYGFTARVDYLAGIIYCKTTTTVGTSLSLSFKPAALITVPAKFTSFIDITTLNNSLVFVKNISPPPSPASLRIDYRSGGKWYRIDSSGLRTLGNDSSIGIGAIAYNGDGTATVSVTLGAEPDVGSKVIYTWASAWGYKNLTGIYEAISRFEIQLPAASENINRISVSFVYSNSYTFVWNGSRFIKTAGGTAELDATFDPDTNKILINKFVRNGIDIVPATIIYDYDVDSGAGSEFTPQTTTNVPDGSGVVTVTLGASVTGGDFYISYPLVMDYFGESTTFTVMVNQAGQIFSLSLSGGEHVSLLSVFNTQTPTLTNFTVNAGAGTVVFHPSDGLSGLIKTYSVTTPVYTAPESVSRDGNNKLNIMSA
ncbi:hypothetical protein [Neptunomonas japonica]|uniref:hypothetical protein n=1 Tax=Neptunomonas japonica TaxID=417574 RepID=UPI000418F02A|nr:hypothetical protein [Neptunomonas japonica]